MSLEKSMSIRNPQLPGRKPGEGCTEFQLHKSQSPGGTKKNIHDYTEFRLKKYIDQVKDAQQKLTLEMVLTSYKKGQVAISWKGGKPVWINVTKESKG
jgi:hypothetical protein